MSEVKSMVDGIVAGDLSQATAHFNAALDAKRAAEWEGAKQHLAHTAFDSPETIVEPVPGETAGQDTGITGDPAEVEEPAVEEE
jgi:hypothetical protein